MNQENTIKFHPGIVPGYFIELYIRLRIYNSKYIIKSEGGCDYVP